MNVVKDENWFRHDFTPTVAGRGEAASGDPPSAHPMPHFASCAASHVTSITKFNRTCQYGPETQGFPLPDGIPWRSACGRRRGDCKADGAVSCGVHRRGDCRCCEELGGPKRLSRTASRLLCARMAILTASARASSAPCPAGQRWTHSTVVTGRTNSVRQIFDWRIFDWLSVAGKRCLLQIPCHEISEAPQTQCRQKAQSEGGGLTHVCKWLLAWCRGNGHVPCV